MNTRFEQIVIVRKLDNKYDVKVQEDVASISTYGELSNIPVYESFDQAPVNIPTLIVAVGGDGTMVHAMQRATEYNNALIVGLAAGNLGFLTDQFSDSQLWMMLDDVARGDTDYFVLDSRMVIGGVDADNENIIAVNEVLITADVPHAPFEYTINVNGQHVATQRGSGVMISTPTGSTAFALSAGGSIINPTAQVLEVVPLAPHSLTSRPIILSGMNDHVEICVARNSRLENVNIVVDGQLFKSHEFDDNKCLVNLNRHEKLVHIIRPSGWNFFEVLSNKMKW